MQKFKENMGPLGKIFAIKKDRKKGLNAVSEFN